MAPWHVVKPTKARRTKQYSDLKMVKNTTVGVSTDTQTDTQRLILLSVPCYGIAMGQINMHGIKMSKT